MSILGLDVGQKRIGVALGTVFAEEYTTLTVKSSAKSFFDENGVKQAIDELNDIINKERIEKIVVGLPMREDGSDSPISKQIKEFSQKVESTLDIPIEFTNETLTSFAAEDLLRDEGLTIKEAKQRIDQVSAKLILQQYLEED
jgi:putative holliday junction resolvase